MKAILQHVRDWLEVYFWIPFALVCIPLAALFIRLLTGRPPAENADWILADAGNLFRCILLIALLSVTREATGVWMTKEEKFAHPWIAALQVFKTCFFAVVFLYLLSH